MKVIDKLKRIIGILMLVLLLIAFLYVIYTVIFSSNTDSTIKEIEKIKFDYVLYERDSNLYKEEFQNLKDELNNDTIDYEKYATYISKLFIIDLYTMNNKISKNDVGGSQYVLDSIKDNYELNVSNTIYKYINYNDELPVVNSILVTDIKDSTYKIKDTSYEGYEVSLEWDYIKDLGYDNTCTLYLIKDNDKLYIVEKK